MSNNQNANQSVLLKDFTIAFVGGSSAPIIEFFLRKIESNNKSTKLDTESQSRSIKGGFSNLEVEKNQGNEVEQFLSKNEELYSFTQSENMDDNYLYSHDQINETFGITVIGLTIGLFITIGIFTIRRLSRISFSQ